MKPKKPTPKAKAEKTEGIYETVNRKRDEIVRNLRQGELPPEYAEAESIMEGHLHSVKKRCTVERRFVLQMLYRLAQPIDIGTLHELICDEYGNVALATVYTTLELLVQLQLAHRLELVSHGMAFFERTLGVEPHGYAVCNQCGAISILRAPQLLDGLQKQLPRSFAPADYTLIVHGLCSKCQRRRRRAKG